MHSFTRLFDIALSHHMAVPLSLCLSCPCFSVSLFSLEYLTEKRHAFHSISFVSLVGRSIVRSGGYLFEFYTHIHTHIFAHIHARIYHSCYRMKKKQRMKPSEHIEYTSFCLTEIYTWITLETKRKTKPNIRHLICMYTYSIYIYKRTVCTRQQTSKQKAH